MPKKLKLKNPKQFEKAFESLPTKHKAMILKANDALERGGSRALMIQVIANGRQMLDEHEAKVNAATDSELGSLFRDAVKEWETALAFMTSQAAELEED